MACCNWPRNSRGAPLLVTPQKVLLKEVDIESFADMVDRTLGDLKQILVSEHLRRLNMDSSVQSNISGMSWDIIPESQTWPPSTIAVPNLVLNNSVPKGMASSPDFDLLPKLSNELEDLPPKKNSVSTGIASSPDFDLLPTLSEELEELPPTAKKNSVPTGTASSPDADLVPKLSQELEGLPSNANENSVRTGVASNPDADLLSALSEELEELPSIANARTHPTSECGTQTQVDWSWPAMPCMPTPPGEIRNHQSPTHHSQSLRVTQRHSWRQSGIHKMSSVGFHHEDPLLKKSLLFGERGSVPKEQTSAKGLSRVFGSMTSETLRNRKTAQADKINQEVSAYAWKRMLVRSKKAPLEVIDATMGVVIFANAISIGWSCDTKDWEQGWLIVDSIFACIFILEMGIKIYWLGLQGYLWSDDFLWHWFETGLVVLSILEILATLIVSDSSTLNGSTIFRVIRLIRLLKICRVCRLPMASDLVMMVSGLIGGSRTLISSFLLVLFPLSIFALVMRETLGEENDVGDGAATNFGTLPKASFNSFRCLVIEDCSDETGRPVFLLVADEYGWFYAVFYSFSLLFLKFGLYNVIIAIFVEQTVQAAKYNATYQKRARLNDQRMFQEKSLEMAELAYSLKQNIAQEKVAVDLTLEEIQTLELSKTEFNELCTHPEFKELLTALDVAEEDHLDLFDTLDVDGGGTLDLGEIVSGIAKLRGDARKSDIVAVILLTRHLNRSLADFMDETEQKLFAIQSFLRLGSRATANQ